jgi:hypothetical protein
MNTNANPNATITFSDVSEFVFEEDGERTKEVEQSTHCLALDQAALRLREMANGSVSRECWLVDASPTRLEYGFRYRESGEKCGSCQVTGSYEAMLPLRFLAALLDPRASEAASTALVALVAATPEAWSLVKTVYAEQGARFLSGDW